MAEPLLEIGPYRLADAMLLTGQDPTVLVWKVSEPCVVVGQSNRVLQSLDLDRLARDRIPVYRRPSGGQPVLLSPRTAQVSILFLEERLTNPLEHFKRINRILIDIVARETGLEALQRGVSDLATREGKKLLGSSIYRGQGRVLYHGVLNLAESPRFISRYLLHPPQEPDYRQGRSHTEFISSLAEEVEGFEADWFFRRLKEGLLPEMLRAG